MSVLCRYDTVGLHLLNQTKSVGGGGRRDNNRYDDMFQDGGDPRVTSWLEDLETSNRGLGERLSALETSGWSNDLHRCTHHTHHTSHIIIYIYCIASW